MNDTDILAIVAAVLVKDRRDRLTDAQIRNAVEDAWKIIRTAHNKAVEETPL